MGTNKKLPEAKDGRSQTGKRVAWEQRQVSRRAFVKSSVVGGGVLLASLYVKPSFRSIGVTPAYAQATPAAGCTPGLWKNHQNDWQGYTTNQLFADVFTVPTAFSSVLGPPLTLLGALQQGGGGAKALGRHGVAALLNAAHADIPFSLSETEVINAVNSALASGDPTTIENTKNTLESANESSCPVGGRAADDPPG